MAATSEEFKAALKEGRIVEALKTALGQSIELEITTTIASSDPETASQIREKGDSGEIMRTRLNIVEGKIETEIGSEFLKGGKFAELRDFHVSQMQASGQIIERNISSLQKLLELWVGMTQQTVVVTDSKTHSSELKSIQPDALASGSSPRPAAFSAPDLRERKEELKPVVARSEPVTTGVTGGTEREQEVTSSEEHDPEVLAAFDLDPSVSLGAASPGSAKSTFPGFAVGTRGGTQTTDGVAFTGDPEIAVPSTENVRENSALKTAAVVAGTAAVVGTAVAAAAGAWGSDEAAASGDLTPSEALVDLDLDVATTSPMADEFEESQELASSWDETELPETTPSEEPVMSESTAIDADPEALVESILESEPVTEDPELEMMDGTEQLASSWDETELWEDEPEPEAIEPDLLAETLVESLTDEDEQVIEESTEDSEVEIMGALETEESGSTLAKEDETAEILGVLETERELAPSWDGTELRSNTEADAGLMVNHRPVSRDAHPVVSGPRTTWVGTLGNGPLDKLPESSADMMGTAEDELAANWEEPETSWETGSDTVPKKSEWGRHGDLQDDYSAVESEMSLAEELAATEWPTDEEDETATEASQAPGSPDGMFNRSDSHALDEFDVDLLGEQPELWSDFSGTVPQGNGTKKATATAGDNSSYDEESGDPLAAQACAFKGEAAFDPLAELFADSDQEEDLNYGSKGTDELDALFSDDVNAGNLEDSFADLELADPPSGSPQIKKKR
ncbi:MAG: hypothetical protein EBE86_033250 [Hormoscilla sp. GUM202]|nr:hypothetical protein [Hormoscilla sp. GUM202]